MAWLNPTGRLDIINEATTWPELDAWLERYKDKYGAYPDLLLLDSADDIAPAGKFDKEYQALRAAYVLLRCWAQEKNMAVWSTGQLTREAVEKARVGLKQIGDAFAKAQGVSAMAAACAGRRVLRGSKRHL